MKPAPVVDRFDEIRAPVPDLEHLAGGGVHLYLPSRLGAHLDDALTRPDVQTVDVRPGLDLGLGHGGGRGENGVETDRWHVGFASLHGRLNPIVLLLQLEQDA